MKSDRKSRLSYSNAVGCDDSRNQNGMKPIYPEVFLRAALRATSVPFPEHSAFAGRTFRVTEAIVSKRIIRPKIVA
jgi:hypothetical protein